MEIGAFVEHHQVAGPKPGVAFDEHVAQNLVFGFGTIGVALEAAAAAVGGSDPTDRFADLAAGASDTKTVGVANGHPTLRIDTDDRSRKTMRQERWNPADRARLAFHIVEREIAFGRRVKLQDLRNRKARLKRFPDVAAQAIAADEPKPMLALEFGYGRLQKIAAKFADILEQGAIPAHDIAPEGAGREFVRQHHRRSRGQHAAGCDD